MDYHQNARLTLHLRAGLAKKVLEQKCTLKQAAACFNVSAKTVAKWVRRYREEGNGGLRDRSSRPHNSPRRTSYSLSEQVLTLRRLRYNGWHIAQTLGLSRATVSRILRRAGLNRLRSLDPPPPVVRYEHKHPGDLIHFDIKRLARIVKPGLRVHGDHGRETRGAGWEYLHVATPPQRASSPGTPDRRSLPHQLRRPAARSEPSLGTPLLPHGAGLLRALRLLHPSRAHR